MFVVPMELRRAALHATLAAASFAVMSAAAKAAGRWGASDVLIVFMRNVVALAVLGPMLVTQGGWQSLKTQRLGGHLWRSGFGVLGMYCLFYAISHLTLAEALLLNYASPLFIPALAWLVLKEKPAPIVIPACVLGLVGVALIVKPGSADFGWPAVVGAASGVFAACAMVSLRRISNTEPPTRIVFYFSVVGVVISAIPLVGGVTWPDSSAVAALVLTGLAATAGQLELSRAYAAAPAARVGAMGYSGVVFAGVLGWLIWDEAPDVWSLVGALLVITTCVLATLQKSPAPPQAAAE